MVDKTLNDFVKDFTLDTVNGASMNYSDMNDWQKHAYGYTLTLNYIPTGKSHTFDFFQGTGITSDPSILGVLECLQGDVRSGDYSFDDFCSEFGYDTDSRSAEKTHNACVKTFENFQELLEGDFEEFVSAEINY